MKATLLLLAPIVLLASCARNQNQAATAPAANPFGIPASEGYGTDATPYQPIDPINPPAMASEPVQPSQAYTPVPPTNNIPAPPAYTPPAPAAGAGAGQHMIQKGDTLWGVSRRYNVSVDALKKANGLSGDTIVEGRSLIIPAR